ncbi:MAG: beta-ketoacyl-ACP synthase II [Candidatus Margulisbacteria bacterium]|nr:beta-ketoacyl-ACP synthase II [Candidatus Margulisiibacteriota bacterium]
MSKRVVVTGMGIVSPLGIGWDKFFDNLCAGKSGISRIEAFDVSTYPSKIAGQVKDFDPCQYLDKKEARRLPRFIQFAVAASKLAVADAKFDISSDPDRVGVIIGSGIGGIDFLEEQSSVLREKGVSKLSPFTVPYMICDMASGFTSILLGAKGPNSCVVTACATGTNAIGDSFKIIQRGAADVMLAGGTEAAICPIGVGSFCAARALSTSYNDAPEKASRPFDAGRDGFVIGEGSGVVVLEELEHANARGAKIYGEIIGYGMSGDANHITAPAPGGEGAVRAIMAALRDADVSGDHIDYINAHGTSTQLNDKFETMALKHVFGDQAHKLSISSNKSMIGHLLGAAGAVEFVATILTIINGIIPPTINYENKDPECDLDYTPNQSRKKNVNIALSESFGFGGHNAVVIAKKFEG